MKHISKNDVIEVARKVADGHKRIWDPYCDHGGGDVINIYHDLTLAFAAYDVERAERKGKRVRGAKESLEAALGEHMAALRAARAERDELRRMLRRVLNTYGRDAAESQKAARALLERTK
jgi:hypothetical protein